MRHILVIFLVAIAAGTADAQMRLPKVEGLPLVGSSSPESKDLFDREYRTLVAVCESFLATADQNAATAGLPAKGYALADKGRRHATFSKPIFNYERKTRKLRTTYVLLTVGLSRRKISCDIHSHPSELAYSPGTATVLPFFASRGFKAVGTSQLGQVIHIKKGSLSLSVTNGMGKGQRLQAIRSR